MNILFKDCYHFRAPFGFYFNVQLWTTTPLFCRPKQEEGKAQRRPVGAQSNGGNKQRTGPDGWGLQVGHFNSLAPGRSECEFKNGIFNLVLLIGIFRSSHDNALRWMPQDLTGDVNIGSGNGLVPSGNKPLPEPSVPCRLMASLGHYELSTPKWDVENTAFKPLIKDAPNPQT